jgi:hypothetical protein
MRWDQGRADIERMLAAGELSKVVASREFADRLLAEARTKLASADRLSVSDPDTAYDALYGAARKALTAILENQGLRPTTRGGHIAPYEAVRAQLVPPPAVGRIINPFAHMRLTRNAVDYPSDNTPPATTQDVRRDLPAATAIVDLAETVLDQMDVF